MRTKGSGNRYTIEQLQRDTERVAEFLSRIRAVTQGMSDAGIHDIQVDKDASYRACLKAVKVWCKSVDDGWDEAVVAGRGGSLKSQPSKDGRKTK